MEFWTLLIFLATHPPVAVQMASPQACVRAAETMARGAGLSSRFYCVDEKWGEVIVLNGDEREDWSVHDNAGGEQ